MLLNDRAIRDLCVPGPHGKYVWAPGGTYGMRFLDQPMLDPFSEQVNEGVVSYGLDHAGYSMRIGYTVKVFKNTYNRIVSPKRFKDDPTYDAQQFDTITGLESGQVVYISAHSYILGYSL